MNNEEAIANLNHLYGMVAPDMQRSLDVAIKALERPQVTVFTETADEKAVADLKAELQSVIEARPQGEWIPINPDCRGYPEYFKCSICGAYIYPNNAEKELDYNGCPYCFADMRGGAEC